MTIEVTYSPPAPPPRLTEIKLITPRSLDVIEFTTKGTNFGHGPAVKVCHTFDGRPTSVQMHSFMEIEQLAHRLLQLVGKEQVK